MRMTSRMPNSILMTLYKMFGSWSLPDTPGERAKLAPWEQGLVRASVPKGTNKKQCSRQLQCKVPCGIGNVINSSLFSNSSLSSLSSTSHAVLGVVWLQGGWVGGGGWGRGRGFRGEGRGCFINLAIYCTTTWCFALKGLRTTNSIFPRKTRKMALSGANLFSVEGAALNPPETPPQGPHPSLLRIRILITLVQPRTFEAIANQTFQLDFSLVKWNVVLSR